MVYPFFVEIIEKFGNMNLVLLFGIIVFLGTFGSRVVQKLHIPQVIGCGVVGVILGGDCLNIISHETVEQVRPFTMLALGFIGFMIGGELKADVFRKYGKQFFIILISQGVGSFLIVSIALSVVLTLITGQLLISIAVSLVFGAIASATAPAATTDVLWEYKTKGPLTTAVLAVVALDNVLALLLYKCASGGAQAIIGAGKDSVLVTVGILLGEIALSIFVGFAAGAALYFLLKFTRSEEKILGFSIALLLILVGNSIVHGTDPILPSITFGITIANMPGRHSKIVFDLIKKFSLPIYTAFFVLAGAHIEFTTMTFPIVVVTAGYMLFRAVGKTLGASVGARYSNAPVVVRKYLGICLLPQAGVAIGLAILSDQLFTEMNPMLSKMIFIVVMTETFIMELLGPMLVKVGVKKAGEIGLNVTEEDLIKTHIVGDVMNSKASVIPSGMTFGEIIKLISTTDSFYYPVLDHNRKLIGAITLDSLRNVLQSQEMSDWLIALDVAEPVIGKITPAMPLKQAFEYAVKMDIEHLPVVNNERENTVLGLLDVKAVYRFLTAEVLARHQKADRPWSPSL